MANTKKTYIILGDNNFWYAAQFDVSRKEAQKELARIKREIKKGVGDRFNEPSEASELYLYEATLIAETKI